ncbi:MAG: Aspartokinase [Chlamydiae bacterium]|nr:Aspartokinase [Chlamydiota bacterium]
MNTLIMKFGGASLSSPSRFSAVADLILKKTIDYDRVLVVVSAMANMTDQLIQLGCSVHPNPPQRELDMLISIGERVSTSLLSMALQAKKCKAISFTGSQSGIITSNKHSQARILDVRPTRLNHFLNLGYVVIVAGFQGVSLEKEITTLGRGGSDTSAVALGISLDADKVEFFKDVEGLYEEDPKLNPHAKKLPFLTYQEALLHIKDESAVLHPRCIRLAEANGIPLFIRSFNKDDCLGTRIQGGMRSFKKKVYETIF